MEDGLLPDFNDSFRIFQNYCQTIYISVTSYTIYITPHCNAVNWYRKYLQSFSRSQSSLVVICGPKSQCWLATRAVNRYSHFHWAQKLPPITSCFLTIYQYSYKFIRITMNTQCISTLSNVQH